jgi:aromatic ring hydroxylase
MMNLASELTSGSYAGYQAVLAVHAEGSVEAEKLAMYRALDLRASVSYALKLAGLEDTARPPDVP